MRLRRLLGGREGAPTELIDAVRGFAKPLNSPRDLNPLMERIGDARFVLLGEASHGTAEYYTWRAEISKRLITEKGFTFIAVEGDWPDCYRVNRFIKDYPEAAGDAREALSVFERWPTWMWANEEVLALLEWVRDFNDQRAAKRKVGFYGLDVYSLWDSLYQVAGYLRKNRPELLPAARRALNCFEPYGEDEQQYARATRWLDESCEGPVVDLLKELRRGAKAFAADGREAEFSAEQNALVVKNAEQYYRTMVRGDEESWNVRDRHMAETLDRLMRFHSPEAKAIIWEHNTHIGDARHTDMADEGMVNVGQLVRQKHEGEGVVLVGFGSHRGSVIAGREWEAQWQRMRVPPGQAGSWEDLLHRAGESDKLLIFDDDHRRGAMAATRGHRAIGVVYRPEYERGNYVPTSLPRRYDAFLYIDETEALHPLHAEERHEDEIPDTYPTGV